MVPIKMTTFRFKYKGEEIPPKVLDVMEEIYVKKYIQIVKENRMEWQGYEHDIWLAVIKEVYGGNDETTKITRTKDAPTKSEFSEQIYFREGIMVTKKIL